MLGFTKSPKCPKKVLKIGSIWKFPTKIK